VLGVNIKLCIKSRVAGLDLLVKSSMSCIISCRVRTCSLPVCVCVCVREREGEGGKEGERERERGRSL